MASVPRRRRSRLTIAALMGLVLALSLPLAVLRPLYRSGRPPCLGPAATACWLLSQPGAASCNACHELTGPRQVRGATPPPPAGPCPGATGVAATAPCLSCHQATPAPTTARRPGLDPDVLALVGGAGR